jgi:hypothetical protein
VFRKEDRNRRLASTAEAGLFQDEPEEDSGQRERKPGYHLLQAWDFYIVVRAVFQELVYGSSLLTWVC